MRNCVLRRILFGQILLNLFSLIHFANNRSLSMYKCHFTRTNNACTNTNELSLIKLTIYIIYKLHLTRNFVKECWWYLIQQKECDTKYYSIYNVFSSRCDVMCCNIRNAMLWWRFFFIHEHITQLEVVNWTKETQY